MATILPEGRARKDPEKAERIQESSEVADDVLADITQVWEREWAAEWKKLL